MDDNKIQEMWNEYVTLLRSTNRDGIEGLIKWLDESDFKIAPASTQYHNCFKGGLLAHSLQVYYCMKDFKHFIEFFEIPEDSIILTALLHDIYKVNSYDVAYRNVKDENGNWKSVPYYTWNEQEPLGRSVKSVLLMYEYGVKPTKLERAIIVNALGFSESKDDFRRVSDLYAKCPQSLVLHWADESATWIFEGYELPDRFKNRLNGNNIIDCLAKSNPQQVIDKGNCQVNKVIQIGNMEYIVAPDDVEVDEKVVITVKDTDGNFVKVYSPYGDGLPF